MVTLETARRLALALPGAEERDHHGRASFRVANRIFATVPDADHLNVMVDEPGIQTYVQRDGATFSEVWWGKRLAAVRVRLEAIDDEALRELLEDAWERRAPQG